MWARFNVSEYAVLASTIQLDKYVRVTGPRQIGIDTQWAFTVVTTGSRP